MERRKENWKKRCKSALLSKVSALALSCCNALMYADDYVSMHVNIWCALSYYPLRALVQPGEPRLSQPWGYTARWWLCHLAKPKRILLWSSHGTSGARRDLYNTPCYSKNTNQTAKTIPSNANKGVCAQKAATFSCLGLETAKLDA